MTRDPVSPGPKAEAPDADLSRTYALVVVVEVAVIATLYWLGRHFA